MTRYRTLSPGRALTLLLVGLLGILSILASTNGNGDNQGYAIAFGKATSIHVRWSEDGLSWSDAGKLEDNGDPSGTALAALRNKTMYIAGWKKNERIRLLQGLGTGNWNDEPMAARPEETALSAPAISFMDRGKWIVAFRASRAEPDLGDRMVVRILNTSVSPPEYLEGNLFEYQEEDHHTESTPAVTYVNGKVLLAWATRPEGRAASLHLATGAFENDAIAWQGHTAIEFDEPNCQPLRSAPVLSHDHSKFYLGFLCGNATQPAQRTLMFIHRSPDGFNWEYYGKWYDGPDWIPANSHIGLAGRADGSLLVAYNTGGNNVPVIARCAGGPACKEDNNAGWEPIDWQSVFGVLPDHRFALISTGEPAE